MEERRGTGVAVGKFDPPHRGHSLLIDVARGHVERLTVLVWDYAEQTVPAEVRASWLRDIHPGLDVRVVPDSPDAVDPESWAVHTLAALGERPDVLFSSEAYGERFARALGAEHYSIDRHRQWVPCSGTMVRRAPLDYLQWLAPCVRAYYVRRVCVAGAESTGKSTLCERLAAHYETNVASPYGRDYARAKFDRGQVRWETDEFYHIAFEQQGREDEAARNANKVLFCDTDAFAARIWHERYRGGEPLYWPLPESKIALYLIPFPDVFLVADVPRDGVHMRYWMHERYIEEFQRRKVPYAVLRGSFEERDAQAIAAIDGLLTSGTAT